MNTAEYLTSKALLNLINSLAEKEETDRILIATYALQLISQEFSDKKLPVVCREIISTGSFSKPIQHLPISKSIFLLNLLEIGKRKYTDLRHLCKTENFIFPPYNIISEYRSKIVCQLCTVKFTELKDLDFIRTGYPINRTISAARLIFDSVDAEEFFSLPSNERFGLTHEPLSNIDIMSASPLHTYTCVFRWFMLVVYHLHSGTYKWSPTSKSIQSSMKFCRELLQEKTGMKIDQQSSEGGTTSNGNIARSCFMNKNNFHKWILTLIPSEFRNVQIYI